MYNDRLRLGIDSLNGYVKEVPLEKVYINLLGSQEKPESIEKEPDVIIM